MSETIPLASQGYSIDPTNADTTQVQSALSRAALEGVGVAAQHFYGAQDHFMERTWDGEHSLIITKPEKEGAPNNEAIGIGFDVETALLDSLKVMRSLETVRTKSLAHIEMTEAASVDFTSFAHYNPKVPPGRDIYSILGHLEKMLADDTVGKHTYDNTIAREGWQLDVRATLNNYVANDPAGRQLLHELKIHSLDYLTPEQAVKLSTAFVQNVSKYTNDTNGNPDGSRADGLTAPELLREGIANKSDLTWEGNGVCRNIASNVKAVFESLKQTQGELSMLNNTYAVYGAGFKGSGYEDKRDDAFKLSFDASGHAWNTFVTVDTKGSAVATIIDATWALGKDASAAIEHLDRTDVRAASQIIQLFEKSERKFEAFEGLSDYTERLIRNMSINSRLGQLARDNIRDYAVTEYLKAAKQLEKIPEDYTLPNSIVGAAYHLRGELEPEEVVTLFSLDKAGGSMEEERLKALISGYDNKRKVDIPSWKRAENLIFKDVDLQELAYAAVGEERVLQLADVSGSFRRRLRQQHPDVLPAFDPYTSQADAQELGDIASRSGINDKDPKSIIRNMNREIKHLAGDDAVAEAIVAGRSEYDLASSFQAITGALRKRRQSS